MKNLFTPEENMILTLDYYLKKIEVETLTTIERMKELENEFNKTGDINTMKELFYCRGIINGLIIAQVTLQMRD